MRTLMLVAGCAAAMAWGISGTALANDESASEMPPAWPAAVPDAAETDAAMMPQDSEPASTMEPATDGTESSSTAAAATETAPPAATEATETAPPAATEATETASPAATEATDTAQAVDGMGTPPAAPSDDAAMPEAEPQPIVLGDIGYDSEGRQGRIHIVVTGDTLWDISDAYLGTPWVWPSIWQDNRDIENPHRIDPGDHIWITDSEMRVISPEEAAAMLANQPSGDGPAAPGDSGFAEAATTPEVGVPSAEQQLRRVSTREWVGLVSADALDEAASIVEKIVEPRHLAQMDRVYIGLGEGEVEVGDAFEIIRKESKVKDPESGRFLGWYVNALGWLEVVEVHAESSLAEIRLSTEDIREGDRLVPRRPESMDIAIQPSPEDVEGVIAFFPLGRVVIGPLDYVYLNRGTLDGLETGSPLEVVRGGNNVSEPVRHSRVEIPQRVVAQLLVVEAQPETAVALVANSETELLVGDSFRGVQN